MEALKEQLQAADTETEKIRISVEILTLILEARKESDDPHTVPMVLYNIPNFTLKGAVFMGANMDDAKLEGVDMEGANFTNADFTWADLSGANLKDAILEEAHLEDTYLEGANLQDAHLANAHLSRADLSGANLQGASLDSATMDVATLYGADLSEAYLEKAVLEYAVLEYANLSGADLTDAILHDADMKGANLQNAILYDADLRAAFLEDANLTGADLNGAQLMGANLERANLQGAGLENAFIEDANLRGANLRGANLIGAELRRSDLTGADLTNAIMEETNLDGAILEGVIGLGQVQPPQPQGLAFEIHNAFIAFKPKEAEYLALIDQSDFEGDIADNIKSQFESNIAALFPGDNVKLEQFNQVFEKSKESLSYPEYKQLIYKSVQFAFSQGDDFKREYIINFLDETCNAYTGPGDKTSCVKGILERYVLSVGNVVQIVCSDGCDNETYKKLDKLMNPKFIIADAASAWWETEAVKEEITNLDKEGRKANFIQYLMAEARRLGSENAQTAAEIEKYANDMDAAFVDLVLGGKRGNLRVAQQSLQPPPFSRVITWAMPVKKTRLSKKNSKNPKKKATRKSRLSKKKSKTPKKKATRKSKRG